MQDFEEAYNGHSYVSKNFSIVYEVSSHVTETFLQSTDWLKNEENISFFFELDGKQMYANVINVPVKSPTCCCVLHIVIFESSGKIIKSFLK